MDNHSYYTGALFELYYCSDGTFGAKPDYDMLERLVRHCHDVNLKCSFEYIHKVLIPLLAQKIAEVCRIPYNYISVNSNKPNYVGRIKFLKDYSFDVAF